MEQFVIHDGDYAIHSYKWAQTQNPKGVVQIIQGLNEHGERYDALSQALNKAGYIVYTHDGIGQGKSQNPNMDTVVFGQKGYQDLVNAIYAIRKRISVEQKGLPVYAIGHSLGALLLRYVLIEDLVEYHKVVFSATGLSSLKGIKLSILITDFLMLFGSKKPSNFFDKEMHKRQLRLANYVELNHFIEYLTRDEIQNELDKKDPYLFQRLSVIGYHELFKLIQFVNTEKNIKETHPAVKVLMLSGTHDPMTNFSLETKDLCELFYRIGIYSKVITYEQARHNLFDETNKEQVFQDVIDFLKS